VVDLCEMIHMVRNGEQRKLKSGVGVVVIAVVVEGVTRWKQSVLAFIGWLDCNGWKMLG